MAVVVPTGPLYSDHSMLELLAFKAEVKVSGRLYRLSMRAQDTLFMGLDARRKATICSLRSLLLG